MGSVSITTEQNLAPFQLLAYLCGNLGRPSGSLREVRSQWSLSGTWRLHLPGNLHFWGDYANRLFED